MATAWDVATVGWTVTVMGWLLSPLVRSLAPKILSYLGFDAEQKLRELKIKIIPELQETLGKVDRARMLQRGKVSHVSTLDDMAGWLRHAREDADDIFDDAQDKIVVADILYGWCVGIARIIVQSGSAWVLHKTFLCRFFPRSVDLETLKADLHKISSELGKLLMENRASRMSPVDRLRMVPKTLRADMLRTILELRRRRPEDIPRYDYFYAMDIWLSRGQAESAQEEAEEDTAEDIHEAQAAKDSRIVDKMVLWLRRAEEEDSQTCVDRFIRSCPRIAAIVRSGSSRLLQWERRSSSSRWFVPLPVTAPSDSSGWWLSCWCSFLDFFKNCCRSIFYWLVDAIGVAGSYRDESYEKVGITGYQEASVLDILPTAISRRNLKKRIEKVENTVNVVKGSPLLSVGTAPNDIADKNRSTIETASNRKVIGREALRDSVMAMLRETPYSDASSSSTSPCYSVIGIYGVARSGKTTFARYIRDHIEEKCKEEQLFDTIMCIHVSETYRVKDIFHEMLKNVTRIQCSGSPSCEDLKDMVESALRGKRFFLILDDLWVKNKNDQQLEELISPLNVGLKGSKILVTARTKVAAGALCADEPIKMPDLDEDLYLKMFMHYALGGKRVADEEFLPVGRVIAEKLHRSPIAAVTVAGRLGANLDIDFWTNTAKLDMLNDTMDALWWSYQFLNPEIRRCFEYCNIFPRRINLRRDELVRMWIAQGFVKTSCVTEDMEDIAEGYIQELASCLFLQPEGKWGGTDWFTIHDLLHDLLDKVTGSDCFRIGNERIQRGIGWKGHVPRDVRHLFVQNYDAELIIKKILRLENLRTLIIYVVEEDTPVEEKIIESICMRMPKLRVLAIAFNQECDPIRNPSHKFLLPQSITHLKHLRYQAIRISDTCTVILPSALAKLHHIQLLDFGHGKISEFTFASLINLRHIFCSCVNFPNVARLSSLQTIPCFTVRNEQGYELKQLRDLNKLCGKLKIFGLERVFSKDEALEANLAAKWLTELTLRWSSGLAAEIDTEVDAEVLEGLCPPVGLQTLRVENYRGSRYPDWMVGKQNGGPNNLQQLHLSCWKQRGPGPQLEAFQCLNTLDIIGCNWDTLSGNMEHLTSLKDLSIGFCPNIQLLPTLPRSLEVFKLYSCNDELMGSCQIVGHPNWKKIDHIREKTFRVSVRYLISRDDFSHHAQRL